MKETILTKGPSVLEVSIPHFAWYELTCSPTLAQAIGCCLDDSFYFRAKQGEWEFATEDEQGNTFGPEDPHHFVLRGVLNECGQDAMGPEACVRIVRHCLSAYRKTKRHARATFTGGRMINNCLQLLRLSFSRWPNPRPRL